MKSIESRAHAQTAKEVLYAKEVLHAKEVLYAKEVLHASTTKVYRCKESLAAASCVDSVYNKGIHGTVIVIYLYLSR